jgi:hypothetical protein
MQQEVRNAAAAMARTVHDLRAGRLEALSATEPPPRPK